MTSRLLVHVLSAVALAIALATGLSAAQAEAAMLVYQSQTGSVSARASTPLISSSDSEPISGLADADATAHASPGGVSGSADLTTSLGATQLVVDAYTSASLGGACDPEFESPCFGQGSAEVTLLFELTGAALVQFHIGPPAMLPSNNVPRAQLFNEDEGFGVRYSYTDGLEVTACGSFSTSECFDLLSVSGPGKVLPAGHYRLDYDVYAFTPSGSCAVGCRSAGGAATLTVVPEPATAALLALGITALAGVSGIRCPRTAGAVASARGRARST